MKFSSETEIKLDLCCDLSDATIIERISNALQRDAVTEHEVCRTFQYYDDTLGSLRAQGVTVRTVGGFTEGLPYRQDVKIGSLASQDRKECSVRTDHAFTQGELYALHLGALSEVAFVHTIHYQWHLVHRAIEITFDRFFDIHNRLLFREIEIESAQDDLDMINRYRSRICAQFFAGDIKHITGQKYDRVMITLAAQSYND